MRAVMFRARQADYKYEVQIQIEKGRCEARFQRAAAYDQRRSEQERARVRYRTFENRDFDQRWFRVYSAWQDFGITQTNMCLDAPAGALIMIVRAREEGAFDPEAIRALTKNLADSLSG